MSTESALNLFYSGQLTDAIVAVTDVVRKQPTDLPARAFLAELLCFTGELERTDRQLDALQQQDPTLAVGVALFRQLLRAEEARQQLFREGRLPEFLGTPTERLQLVLQATIALRENQDAEAMALLTKADEQFPTLEGTCDDMPFVGCRDIDDLTATLFEVLTSNGKYFWVPMEQVELLEFRPVQRTRDLLWRRARMVVRDGPDGEVFLPALYPGASGEADERLRMGQMTEWRGGEGKPVRGVGQRMLLIGEVDRPLLEIQTLAFRPAPAPPG